MVEHVFRRQYYEEPNHDLSFTVVLLVCMYFPFPDNTYVVWRNPLTLATHTLSASSRDDADIESGALAVDPPQDATFDQILTLLRWVHSPPRPSAEG